MKKSKDSIRASQSVFEQIGFSGEESRILTLKAQLAAMIARQVEKRGISQKQLGKLWDVSQPRVSEVLSAKLGVVSIERLLEFLGALEVEVVFKVKPRSQGAKRLAG